MIMTVITANSSTKLKALLPCECLERFIA
jgi:hypothetical protein